MGSEASPEGSEAGPRVTGDRWAGSVRTQWRRVGSGSVGLPGKGSHRGLACCLGDWLAWEGAACLDPWAPRCRSISEYRKEET